LSREWGKGWHRGPNCQEREEKNWSKLVTGAKGTCCVKKGISPCTGKEQKRGGDKVCHEQNIKSGILQRTQVLAGGRGSEKKTGTCSKKSNVALGGSRSDAGVTENQRRRKEGTKKEKEPRTKDGDVWHHETLREGMRRQGRVGGKEKGKRV